MSKKKPSPPIQAHTINLVQAYVKANYDLKIDPKEVPQLTYDFHSTHTFNEEKTAVSVTLGVVLWKGHENVPVNLSAEIIGNFSTLDGKSQIPKEFAEVAAPTIMFPYLRQVVSDLTGRLGVPPLIVQPMNVAALTKQAKPADAHSSKSSKKAKK